RGTGMYYNSGGSAASRVTPRQPCLRRSQRAEPMTRATLTPAATQRRDGARSAGLRGLASAAPAL
ncbi:hypothetical protein, partial [Methylobacterium iners]|uniref:hypothetical protein n=1 Tax=Methylobacterium iners TaxID=418707 RepID=UPI001EE36D84